MGGRLLLGKDGGVSIYGGYGGSIGEEKNGCLMYGVYVLIPAGGRDPYDGVSITV